MRSLQSKPKLEAFLRPQRYPRHSSPQSQLTLTILSLKAIGLNGQLLDDRAQSLHFIILRIDLYLLCVAFIPQFIKHLTSTLSASIGTVSATLQSAAGATRRAIRSVVCCFTPCHHVFKTMISSAPRTMYDVALFAFVSVATLIAYDIIAVGANCKRSVFARYTYINQSRPQTFVIKTIFEGGA
mmetsp:Transcript_415/g.953  ORF Transcript_415/g.953 Transcript_415/m.953 type:complete len:184 (+) Transcript_415:57-608(+)